MNADQAPAVGEPTSDTSNLRTAFTFEGSFDSNAKQLLITYRFPNGERFAETIPAAGGLAAQSTLPYGTSAGQVYFNTQPGSVAWQGTCGTSNLCAQVRAVNNTASSISAFTAIIDSVTGTGVTATGFPKSYGTVAAGTSSGYATWSFNNPSGSNFTFIGHADGTTAPSSNGTVRNVAGTSLPATFVPCGSGAQSGCTEAVAASSCTSIGLKLASHASNGSSSVVSLGATTSCNWSISYYTVSSATVAAAGSCLVGVSNADYSGCCGTTSWHGNTVAIPTTLNQQFGYVDPSNSGYNGGLSNVRGATWGCLSVATPPAALGGCSKYYVACN